MKEYISRHLRLVFSATLLIALSLIFLGVTVAQEQYPSVPQIPQIPGGIKVPGLQGANAGFSGLGALSAAKELQGQGKTAYPTANIAVSGNHIVIAWPNGVVSIETVAQDGTLTRAVLGPPTENNIASVKQ
jgi:hypothetical protein